MSGGEISVEVYQAQGPLGDLLAHVLRRVKSRPVRLQVMMLQQGGLETELPGSLLHLALAFLW